MSLSIDLSLLVTLFSIIVLVLTGLVYWGKPNFLIFIQKGIISEMAASNRDLMDKAERYSHGTKLSGPKIRIKRMLSKFSREYAVPNSVLVISGMASVAWLFCFFLVTASYIYSGIKSPTIVNAILLVAQTNIAAMLQMAWFGRNNSVERPVLFLISSLLWWMLFTFAAILMAVSGAFFHVITIDQLQYAFYSFSLIPLIPILWGVCLTMSFLTKESRKYKELETAGLLTRENRCQGGQKSNLYRIGDDKNV